MNWKIVPFGRFLKERRGKYKPEQANELGLKRVEKIDFSGKIFVGDKTTNTDMILVKSGDLLISGINAEKGAISVYEGEDDVFATIHYSAYQYDKNLIDIDYLKWFLKSDAFRKLLRASAANGIKTELRAKHLLPLAIALPPLAVQHEIIAQLNARYATVEAIEANLTRQQAQLTDLKQAILREAVQGQLTARWRSTTEGSNPPASKAETGAELLARIRAHKQKLILEGKLKKEKPLPPITPADIPFDLPDDWVWCRLGEIMESSFYGPRFDKNDYVTQGGIPTIRTTDITLDGQISLENAPCVVVDAKKLELYRVLDGDLVLTRTGSSIGTMAIFRGDGIALPSAYLIRFRFSQLTSPEFILRILKSPFWKSLMVGNTTTTAVPNINATSLSAMPIPLPPLSEQQAIVARVGSLLERADAVAERLAVARQQAGALRQAVLREAFAEEAAQVVA